jgi:hypothetical protein
MAFMDQARAARNEVRRLVASSHLGTPVRDGRDHPVVARFVRELESRLQFGLVDTCPHAASPQPPGWSTWDPGVIRCIRCQARALAAMRGTVEDHICDNCQRVVESIWSGVFAYGPIVIAIGLCPNCYRPSAGGTP